VHALDEKQDISLLWPLIARADHSSPLVAAPFWICRQFTVRQSIH